MKINDFSPQVEVSAQLEEQFFSIQDQGMIFDILRNKMYSNPILAICREISCNARDAHRELNKADDPIHIHIPNSNEPFYKVKDFGPGISPDRMSNIFIKYTASTKRNDNIQTGGFGLGAKTPFSYSDSFTIITNYNGKQYNYACFIDETKIGKLTLLSETSTNEVNGSEIIVPVKSKDFSAFADYTEQATRYWQVRPIIKGTEIFYKESFPIIQGTDWSINQSSDWNRSIRLIVDGIAYPCDIAALSSYGDRSIIDSARGNLLLYFGVGELSLSANREQIYLDATTKTAISNKLTQATQEIRFNTQRDLDNCSNYWEANVYYRSALQQAFSNLSFLNALSWKGISLISGHPDVGCPIITFAKGKHSRRLGTDPNKISKSTSSRTFVFTETCALYINDLGIKDLTVKHVRKGFENNPNIATIQVICPNEKTSLEALNNSFHLDQMAPIPLSSITKSSSRARKFSNNNRLVIFQYDKTIASFKQTSHSSFEDDQNKKILCLLRREEFSKQKTLVLKNGNSVSMNLIGDLLSSNKDCSFYAVDNTIPSERLDEDFSDCEDLEDFLEEKITVYPYEYYVKLAYINSKYRETDRSLIRNAEFFNQKISNPNSIFLKKLACHQVIDNTLKDDFKSLSIYREFKDPIPESDLLEWVKNNPNYDIVSLNLKCEYNYPLLSAISTYDYSEHLAHIAQYVNLIDASQA